MRYISCHLGVMDTFESIETSFNIALTKFKCRVALDARVASLDAFLGRWRRNTLISHLKDVWKLIG